MKILRLTVKKKWFDMINAEVKNEEYRTPSKWILSRLFNKDGTSREYDLVQFRNGYRSDSPTCYVEYIGNGIVYPVPSWTDNPNDEVIGIFLGKKVNYTE